MCGCIFNGLSSANAVQTIAPLRQARAITPSQLALQAGRLTSYMLAGGIANLSIGNLRNLASYSAALKPLWTMLLVAAVLLGISLVIYARQPLWMERATRQLSATINRVLLTAAPQLAAQRGPTSRYVAGLAWALLPCGLLYSALLVAALANDLISALLAMAAFAVGSGVSLQLWSFVWSRAQASDASPKRSPKEWQANIGTRLAGAALAVFSVWAIMHNLQASKGDVWCLVPAF